MTLVQTAVRATIRTQYHVTIKYTSHRPRPCPGGGIKDNSCERKGFRMARLGLKPTHHDKVQAMSGDIQDGTNIN